MPASSTPTERNIEIKARIPDGEEEFQRRVKIAQNLTNSEGESIIQRDVFFNSQNGRLKLRYSQLPAVPELIYYDRPDIAGPKLSKYNKVEVKEPVILERILAQSNGMLGVLEKIRLLFLYRETRIHFDKVEGLGNFMEFELRLTATETIQEGQSVVDKLMEMFCIRKEDLIEGSYFDKLRNVKRIEEK